MNTIKKTKLRIHVLLTLLPLALPCPVLAEAGWTDYAGIAELVPTARHYYEVRIPVRNNPGGCREGAWFYQDWGLKGSDKMFETLLQAVQAGKQVRVYVTGKCNLNGYAEFTAVGIVP